MFLINNSRGGKAKADLVEAIKEKRIAGAGMDVCFASEPPSLSHPYHSILTLVDEY